MLYLFDKNEKLIHELNSYMLENLVQEEELNKLMSLSFSVLIDYKDYMKDIVFVAHKDMENPNGIQMYRIVNSESDEYSIHYEAIHIFFDELKSYGYIREKRPHNVKASQALEIALDGSKWSVGVSDDSILASTNFYDISRLEAIAKIISVWNMDIYFYLTFTGTKISGRYVHLRKQLGSDTGQRYVYGMNALKVVKETDQGEIYTRLIPRGKGEEKIGEDGQATGGYGRRIKIDEVEWSKSKGDPIDKPKGIEYIELKEMTQKFGFADGTPRSKVVVFEDCETPEELIKEAYKHLVNVSRPLVQFKTEIYKKSRTQVGDIVNIIRRDLDLFYKTRIYKVKRNLLNNAYEVEFGDKLVISPAEKEKELNSNIQGLNDRVAETETIVKGGYIDKIIEQLENNMYNSDGYNYELKAGNEYNLPAGYYSFDREINDNPTKVIYVGAGTIAIANSKKSNGEWDWRTFGTGDGFTADLIVAGMLKGGKVKWNLEDGTFIIGNSPSDYSLYWDGSVLHINADVNITSNPDFIALKNKVDKKITKDEILTDPEIRNALKGRDGRDGTPGATGPQGPKGNPGKDGATPTPNTNTNTWWVNGRDTGVAYRPNVEVIRGDLWIDKKNTNIKVQEEEYPVAYADDVRQNKVVVNFSLTQKSTSRWIGFYVPVWGRGSKTDPKNYWWTKIDPTEIFRTIKTIQDIQNQLKIKADKVESLAEKVKNDMVEVNAKVNGLTTTQKQDIKDILDTIELIRYVTDENSEDLNAIEDTVREKLADVYLGFDTTNANIEDFKNVLNAYINNLPNDIKAQIQDDEIIKQVKLNFDFSTDGLIIGKDGSRYKVSLDNEQLSFKQDGQTVAYINGHRLFITEVEIMQSLKIHNLLFTKYEGAGRTGATEEFVMVNWVD